MTGSGKRPTLSRRRVALYIAISLALATCAGALGFNLGERAGYEGSASRYEQARELGFEDGFSEAQLSSSAMAGATAVHLSGLLRQDRSHEAIAFLEGSIDDSLILYSGFSSRAPSAQGNPDLRAQARRSMERVAEHRAKYPIASEYPLVRETIDATLASLAQGTN